MFEKAGETKKQLERTNQELQACLARLHTIMTRSPHGILIVNMNRKILFANPTAATIFGCKMKELLDKQFDFPIELDKTTELKLKSRDGKTVAVEAWAIKTEWNADKAYFIALHNITERKQNEQELRKLYRAVLQSPSIVMITDAGGNLEFVNPKFTEVTGYTFAEVAGKNPRILKSNKTSPEVYRELWEAILAGREWRGQMVNRKKNGELYWESASISPIRDIEGKITSFIAVTEDITERKLTEEALRFSEARYRALFRDNPIMIVTLDAEWTMLSVNPPCASQLGYTIDELEGQSVLKLFHEDDRSAVAEQLRRCLQHPNQVHRWQFRKVRKDGVLLWVEEIAQAVHDLNGALNILVVCQDITERKRAEEALRKSEKKFLTVFHAVPAILGITTLAEGRFIDVNETCVRILGYQRDEVIGRTSLELGIWKSQEERDRAIRALEKRGTVRDIEINLRGKTGESFVGLLSAEFIDIDGEQYILSMINDITERKRAAEEIERLNTDLAARAAELEGANRELEAFNYTVAHDLRKPLTVVNGYCQAIRELCGNQLDEACKGYLLEAYDGTLRMNRLIDALLNFSRLAHVEPRRETADLSVMVHKVAEELKLAEPERRVTFLIADGVTADGDAALLRVVLDNLLGNAWKYTGMREEGVIEFGLTEVDGKPALFVRDNGAGFDMANANRLFTPFQRLPGAEESRGFGIGLATVERIVNRHGGKVWAEGEPGKGACFYFTLSAD